MTSDSTAAYAAIVKLRLGLPAMRSAAEVDYVPRSGGTLGHLSISRSRETHPPRYRYVDALAPDYQGN